MLVYLAQVAFVGSISGCIN